MILMAAHDLEYKLDPEYAALYLSGTVESPASKALSRAVAAHFISNSRTLEIAMQIDRT
jgi:hypothetical protein